LNNRGQISKFTWPTGYVRVANGKVDQLVVNPHGRIGVVV